MEVGLRGSLLVHVGLNFTRAEMQMIRWIIDIMCLSKINLFFPMKDRRTSQ